MLEEELLQYQLRRRYWDGMRMHTVGDILSFPKGGAPSSAKLVESDKSAGKPAAAKTTK